MRCRFTLTTCLLIWTWAALCGGAAWAGEATPPLPAAAHLAGVPPTVRARLREAGLPDSALAAIVLPADSTPERSASGEARLAWQAELRRPAASLMKLFTTFTALERLGPAWAWRTPVWLDGEVDAQGTLQGQVVLQGSGDPSLTVERLWLLLQQVQRRGVRAIAGDIVLDDRSFPAPSADAAAFDGDALKPYNVPPRGLLFALGSITLGLHPQIDGRFARVEAWPELAEVRWPERVPLSLATRTAAGVGACGDWQAALRLDWSRPERPQLRGSYPAACGEREWHLAWPDGPDHARRLMAALWRQSGGRLQGKVRAAQPQDGAWLGRLTQQEPSFWFESPPLAEVVRSVNKFSNNLMARQLFLTLGRENGAAAAASAPASAASAASAATPLDAARRVVAAHARERAGCGPADLLMDNGAGLSRVEATSAACLARLLQAAWGSAVMPELLASLPIAGVDGTTRRMAGAVGRAHLKTGTLNDVAGIAGFVQGDSGRRWIVVGVVVGPDAPAARPALDALVTWVADDRAAR